MRTNIIDLFENIFSPRKVELPALSVSATEIPLHAKIGRVQLAPWSTGRDGSSDLRKVEGGIQLHREGVARHAFFGRKVEGGFQLWRFGAGRAFFRRKVEEGFQLWRFGARHAFFSRKFKGGFQLWRVFGARHTRSGPT